jgi:flavin reductase (DIM6/NTAB) family NADH-FMN oxidoreductase RutF
MTGRHYDEGEQVNGERLKTPDPTVRGAAEDEGEIQRFRESLRNFPSGVTVVTIADGTSVHGMTASSFTSVSLNPRLCSVSVNKPGRMHSLLSGTDGVFGISMMTEDQRTVADLYARRPWAVAVDVAMSWNSGCPVISGSLVWLVCRKWATYEGGDHTIFVGQVLDHGAAESEGAAPLVHHNSTYHRLGSPMGSAAAPLGPPRG